MLGYLGFAMCCWAYFELAQLATRTDFGALISFYTLAFIGLSGLYYSKLSWPIILLMGIVFRFIFWNHIPVWSQDFYRFLWDGQLHGLGINPYGFTPDALIQQVLAPHMQGLYDGMGALSQQNYSNYPPASQWLFALAAGLGGSALTPQLSILRIVAILSDVLCFWGLRKVLKTYKLPPHGAIGYYLNPLLIIEGTANLHTEGLMLAAVCWGMVFFNQKRWFASAFFWALSVALKLLPLLWLPLLLQHIDRKGGLQLIGYGAFITAMFWGGYMGLAEWTHYLQTLRLWFVNFEFNASWYYLIRAWGYQQTGYNIIQKLGEITPWMIASLALLFTLWPRRGKIQRLWQHALGLLSLYYFTATTVHPWYVIHLVFLGGLTHYRYPWLWSYTVAFSYIAYQETGVKEPVGLVWIEYTPVLGLLAWEWWHYNMRKRLTSVSLR